MTKHFLFTAIGLSLAVTACSSGGGGETANNSGESEHHKHSYRFILNGCDTGKHDFSSTSAMEAQKQLCEALQNDRLNNSCAEPLRREFFSHKCSGFDWNPNYGSVAETPRPNMPQPVEPASNANDEKARNGLRFLLADNMSIEPSLSAQEKGAVVKLGEDLMSCGFSYLGPKCSDYETFIGDFIGSANDADGKYIFYSELRIKGTGTPIAFLFTLNQLTPSLKINSLEVLKIAKPRNGRNLGEFLKDKSNFLPLLRVEVPADFQKAAWQRLQEPRDIRELFHVNEMLLESSPNPNIYGQVKSRLIEVIRKNRTIIVNSEDTSYQDRILSLIMDEVPVGNQLLVEICDGLINSKSEKIQQIAAAVALAVQPSRVELKPIVLKALSSNRWDIRLKAIQALSKVKKTTAEENQLLAKLEDRDEDVRKAAIQAAAKISVNEQNLDVVKQLAASPNWAARDEAVKLLGRINSQNATNELIGMLNDRDEDVRKEVVSQLTQKSLGEKNVPALARQLTGWNWAGRDDAAKFLGKVDSDSAVMALIGAMGDDDDEVRKTIFDQLNRRHLGDSHVIALAKQFGSHHWSVRREVSILLGKINGFGATSALIVQMIDLDEDVRNEIVLQLNRRTLGGEAVASLKKNFDSRTWSVRRDVAKLLGKIKTAGSLEALQAQLLKEDDEDVRSQIVTSIRAVK